MKAKLCVLVNSLAGGGAEKVALTLFEEYRRQGVDVVLLCLEHNNVQQMAGLTVHYLSTQTGYGESAPRKLISLLNFARKLKHFVKDNKITFVQSHIYRSNYVNILARKLGSNHKTQIVNHGIASRYFGEGLQGKINLFLIRWLYPDADQLVCPSVGMLKDIQDIGVSVASGKVIGNPFDIEKIQLQSKEPVSSQEFIFKDDKIYLVSVGRLEKVKCPELIIQALSILTGRIPNLELLFLGAGDEAPSLMVLTEKLGLEGKVHFLGQVNNPFKYVSHSDVFISASKFEGFSNVIVEALIAGTAVVSTDCPTGPREILAPDSSGGAGQIPTGEIQSVDYGILVPVGDVESMVKAIEYLLLNNSALMAYAIKGLKRVEDYSVVNVAGRYKGGSGSLVP